MRKISKRHIGSACCLPPPVPLATDAAFLRGLTELGYVERQNFVLEARYATGKIELLPSLALISYGANLADIYRRAAGFADRILKGARPGDLAVEQPTLFDLSVNAKTAATLGLSIPRPLLARANKVVE